MTSFPRHAVTIARGRSTRGTLAHHLFVRYRSLCREGLNGGAFAWYKFSFTKDECPYSPWLETHLQSVEETDPSKLKEWLGPLEIAMIDRLPQIEPDANSVDERRR